MSRKKKNTSKADFDAVKGATLENYLSVVPHSEDKASKFIGLVEGLLERAKSEGRGAAMRKTLRQLYENAIATWTADLSSAEEVHAFCQEFSGQPHAVRAFNALSIREGYGKLISMKDSASRSVHDNDADYVDEVDAFLHADIPIPKSFH